eukprot:GHVO01008627.1.p1 GENE.GHVO01008627.1~~GHVO01008627.1.p1  ORF type:complete len:194 (-),score=22.11 GHVO01008627.1:60-587(-)
MRKPIIKKKNKENKTPVIKKSKPSKASPASSLGDSGVFMTPPSLLTTDLSAVTSTPSVLPASTPANTCDEFTGFNSDDLSPVQKVGDDGQLVTSQITLYDGSECDSVAASPVKIKTLNISKTYESGTSPKKKSGKRKKALPKKYQKSISKAEEIAMKMNLEFEELDNFTLSVQDE